MKKTSRFLLKFVMVAALLGFFSPSIREIRYPDGRREIGVKLLSQAEARRGGRGGGRSFRGGGGRSFRGGGMRSRPSFSRSRPSRSVRRSRYNGGNFHRAPHRVRPVRQRPAAGKRPVSSRRPVKRPGATRPVNRPVTTQPVRRPGQTRPVQRPDKRPATIQPVKKPGAERPSRPGSGHRPGRPGQRPITIQPTENPLTGRPMPGHPGYRPPGHRPPGTRPPGQRPPGGRPPVNRPPQPPYYGHPGWHDDWYDDWYWPAGAVTAGIVIGSIVAALPSGCQTVEVEGTTYYYCNGTYYLPYYEGNVLKYRVVNPPK